MLYCKDFNSLSVLSLYEGELLGKVDKLYFDSKLKKLCEVEIVSEDGAKIFLQTKNIYHVGKNAITIKNNQLIEFKNLNDEMKVVPISSKVYSFTGEYLGTVQDVSVDDKFLTQKIYLCNGKTLDIKNLASVGKNIVVFYNEQEKIDLNKFNPIKQPKVFKKKVIKVKSMPIVETEKDEMEVKQISVQNVNFLIGRTCTKDIFNFNNEMLIKANGIVNKKNLKEINRFGKLRELMLYIK